jgi:hypothetical protein
VPGVGSKLYFMSNAISFKFNFETDKATIAHELLPRVIERLRRLQEISQGPAFLSVELSLLKPGQDKKSACLTIHTHDSVIREEARDQEWEKAVEAVFANAEASYEHSIKLD